MPLCQTVPSPDAYASGMIGFLDCQAQNIGAAGYRALAAHGSSASIVLAALLTIFVAFIGYRMLFGDLPSLRETVLSAVKIGVVLALATGWPAYQVLVFDVVLRAPAELAAEIGGASGLPGATGGLPARLDGVDRAFETLALYGVGVRRLDTSANTPFEPQRYAPSLFVGYDAFAIGTSRAIFLASAIGGFALVRLGAGLLLALGPLFLAFLLFDGTRGLFEGWARALISTALGSLVIAIVLGVELALFEPWLADLIARRAAGEAITGTPTPLLATSAVFAVVLAGLLLMAGRMGFAFSLSRTWPAFGSSPAPTQTVESARQTSNLDANPTPVMTTEGRSRALTVADSIAAAQSREDRVDLTNAHLGGSMTGVAMTGRRGTPNAEAQPRLGQTYRRRTGSRVSASAGARDRRA